MVHPRNSSWVSYNHCHGHCPYLPYWKLELYPTYPYLLTGMNHQVPEGPHSCYIPIINGHFGHLNWRYLPYIRPIFQALVSGISPQKMAKHMVQYLHFRILKLPLILYHYFVLLKSPYDHDTLSGISLISDLRRSSLPCPRWASTKHNVGTPDVGWGGDWAKLSVVTRLPFDHLTVYYGIDGPFIDDVPVKHGDFP